MTIASRESFSAISRITSAKIAERARRAMHHPSFWGHPYTCDGQQVPGLPAFCAPQQILFTLDTGGGYRSITGFIDTPALFASAVPG